MATSEIKTDSKHRPDSNHREDSYSGVNDGGMVVFILSMVVTFAMFIYVSFFSGGIDLKEIKPPVAAPAGEAAPAGTAKDPGQK